MVSLRKKKLIRREFKKIKLGENTYRKRCLFVVLKTKKTDVKKQEKTTDFDSVYNNNAAHYYSLLNNNGRVGLSPSAESNNSTRDEDVSTPTNGICINGLGNGCFNPDLQKKNTYQLGHYILAKRLHTALNKINYARHPKTKITTWAKQLSQMEKRSTPRPRLRAAINWYINRCMDGSVKDENNYIPQIYSIQSLDTKFNRIEAAMKRHQEKTLPTKISKETKRIVKELNNTYTWPKGFSEHLPGVIQKSLDNFNEFIKALKTIKGKHGLINHLMEFLDPAEFVQEWMETGYKQVADWDNWSGEPKTLIFSVSNKKFQRLFLGWITEYEDDPQTSRQILNRIMEFVNGN